MKLKSAKSGLFIFLLLLISLPLLQHNLNFIESGKLKIFTPRQDVQFTIEKWWNGTYEQQKSEFLNDSFGFRPDFVRVNNQLDLWLFKKLYIPNFEVIVGKDNYLFQQIYIDEYNGVDFIGDDVIANEFWKLKRIQDTLEKLGKTLVFTYGSAKPYYFPEKIPSELLRKGGPHKTNYRSCVRIGDSLKLNQIDFAGWLLATNNSDKNSIIGKRGSHWTPYASLLAADSLIKYLERLRHITMPEIKITSVHRTDSERFNDENFSLNSDLVFPIKKEKQACADFHYVFRDSAKKPKIIYIGDSFINFWLGNQLMATTNSYWEYWFYFDKVWTEKTFSGVEKVQTVHEKDWIKSITDADCVVILWTSFNLWSIKRDDFYIEGLYHHFYPGK